MEKIVSYVSYTFLRPQAAQRALREVKISAALFDVSQSILDMAVVTKTLHVIDNTYGKDLICFHLTDHQTPLLQRESHTSAVALYF